MKNILLATTIIFSLSICPASGQSSRLANRGKAGLYVKSLDQVLRLTEDEMDLATAALIASEYWSDMVHGRRYLEQLDAMALEIHERLRQQRYRVNHNAIPIINDYLFNELGYKTIAHADDPNDLFLHSVMDRRQGYCLSLSVLYLALAERLGLNVHGVVVPGHFFVRYESGRTRFNIETTSGGAKPPDGHYVEKFDVPQGGRHTIYMDNLTKRQTLGCFFNNLGNVYHDIGDTDTALLALERAVAINPTLSESRANLGNIYREKGQTAEAIRQYQAALNLNPNDPKIHNNLGNIYLEKGQTAKAVRQYQAALDLNPNDPKTHNNLGNAYMELDRLTPAVSSYRQALALDPDLVDAYRNLALVYIKLKQYGYALGQLRQAVSIAPREPAVYNQLGDLYFRMDKYQTAISQFHKALRLKRDSAEAYYGLALCYRKLNQVTNEIQAYKNTLSLKPDMLPALVNLGNAYFAQADYESAINYYGRALEMESDDAWIYYNLGSAYSSKGDFALAVEAYEQAIEVDPEIGDAHHGLAYALYMLKQYDRAWKHIQLAKKFGAQVSDEQMQALESRVK